ncbi:N5-carboxyaminoimidazole ribonucleotide synthase [Capsulimonas corticalis]|uniref:N5-carboxyaminoimidazole ribonucleotide synthase n=1 Tax=Capsulimonas corticalis TaxID=2219043 RepID=A0A402CPP4_9BACT|nr:5-(carboxyamino)imidazole ribonucleotide synthase [Capsulimonas corticalis]BDI32883.1 N5-carboxyaminoimidazole ribonucleotide synthase [Capsulimonas corticalis]
MSEAILPGATIGILGSGQLGRMLALAAREMGYGVAVYSPEANSPTGQIADIEVVGAYDDLDALRAFAHQVDVVTQEFENVPVAALDAVGEIVSVRPGRAALHTAQHRLREKTFLHAAGIPCAPFRAIDTAEDLARAVEELGAPCVLKTAGFGYDGKGQAKILHPEDAIAAWDSIDRQPAVLEGFIDFERELSLVGARGVDGEFAHFGLVENTHAKHILDVTLAPATVPEAVLREAEEIARTIFQELEVVGVLCVEFFLGRNGNLLVNEIAPRTHNSGHWTIDGCVTSQFEQQLRAVCGLPLGSTEMLRPGAAMANLLGDVWPESGSPNWAASCAIPGVKLHLYGKAEARPGRKMGHLNAAAETPEAAAELVRRARAALG